MMAAHSSIRLHIAGFKLRNCLSGPRKYACISQAPIGTSWRGFCSDSKSKDDKSIVENADSAVESKETAAKKKEAISKQLLQQILSMKVTGNDYDKKEPMILAKPTWGERQQKLKEQKKIEKETPREHPDLDAKVVSAVKDVAVDLGGNVENTESELIKKLKSYNAQTEEIKNGTNLVNLVAGLKIDRTRAPAEPGVRSRGVEGPDEILDERGRRLKSFKKYRHESSRRPLTSESMALAARADIDLFGAPLLNIFTKKSTTSDAPELDFPVLETWDKLEKEELKLLVTQPFANAFEEQIQWTKEGKLWKFPINNEQGLEEEAKVGFHEHVFLEPLIEDFPKKGPIRHFMELVLVGLSKNSYLTVQQKKDHIDWFRNYFKDKEAMLKDVGALG